MEEESERIRPPWLISAAEAANIWASLGDITISDTGRGREVRGMGRELGGEKERGGRGGVVDDEEEEEDDEE